MRIIVLTQSEDLYLPASLGYVCGQLGGEIVCIVSSPVMSTHGGSIRGVRKHLCLFGPKACVVLAMRSVQAKVASILHTPQKEGPFFSIRQVAKTFKIPFYRVARVNDSAFHTILDQHGPDLLISLSCPQIIGKKIRERMAAGCINVHGSPLPKYRGLMPAFWVLCNGEERTAVTVHDLEAKLDDGAILIQTEVEIAPEETWDSLVRKTKRAGAEALVEAVMQIKSGTAMRKPNRKEEATYFSWPNKADRRAFLARGRRFF